MSLIRRYLTGFRGVDTLETGLFEKDDGTSWYRKPDGSEVEIGSGGGSGGFLTSTVTLTDAQIKALPTTPVQLLAAPGAGKAIYCPVAAGSGLGPESVLAVASLGWAADYSNLDAGVALSFRYQDGLNQYGSQNFPDKAGFLAWGDADGPVWFLTPADITASAGGVNSASVFASSGIFLAIANGARGDLTGGDPTNSMSVTVFYAIVDV